MAAAVGAFPTEIVPDADVGGQYIGLFRELALVNSHQIN